MSKFSKIKIHFWLRMGLRILAILLYAAHAKAASTTNAGDLFSRMTVRNLTHDYRADSIFTTDTHRRAIEFAFGKFLCNPIKDPPDMSVSDVRGGRYFDSAAVENDTLRKFTMTSKLE